MSIENLLGVAGNQLRYFGMAVLPNWLDAHTCDALVRDIKSAMQRNKEKVQCLEREGMGGDLRLFGVDRQSEAAESVANDDRLRGLASRYCGWKVKPYFAVAGQLAYSTKQVRNSGGGWHRDSHQTQVKAIFYLSDVDRDSGPFAFLPNSKGFSIPPRNADHSTRFSEKTVLDLCRGLDVNPVLALGSRGTCVLVDTSYVHCGMPIKTGERITLTTYYYPSGRSMEKSIRKRWNSMLVDRLEKDRERQ